MLLDASTDCILSFGPCTPKGLSFFSLPDPPHFQVYLMDFPIASFWTSHILPLADIFVPDQSCSAYLSQET